MVLRGFEVIGLCWDMLLSPGILTPRSFLAVNGVHEDPLEVYRVTVLTYALGTLSRLALLGWPGGE